LSSFLLQEKNRLSRIASTEKIEKILI